MSTVVSVKVYINRLCYDYSAFTKFSFFFTALRRAFSTMGALEDAEALSTGSFVSMSKQEFVDCDSS